MSDPFSLSIIPEAHRAYYQQIARERASLVASRENPPREPTEDDVRAAAAAIVAELPEKLRERLFSISERRAQVDAAAATRIAAAQMGPSLDQIAADAAAELDRAERRELDAKALADALAKYGRGRVARVRTVDGDIILRCIHGEEFDRAEARLMAARKEDLTAIGRELTLDGVIHPSRDRAREIASRYPAVWVRLFEARDALQSGEEGALTGKV